MWAEAEARAWAGSLKRAHASYAPQTGIRARPPARCLWLWLLAAGRWSLLAASPPNGFGWFRARSDRDVELSSGRGCSQGPFDFFLILIFLCSWACLAVQCDQSKSCRLLDSAPTALSGPQPTRRHIISFPRGGRYSVS